MGFVSAEDSLGEIGGAAIREQARSHMGCVNAEDFLWEIGGLPFASRLAPTWVV
jgi:hypothetical protein